MPYGIQQCFRSLVYPHRASKIISDLDSTYTIHTGQGETPLTWPTCIINRVRAMIHATHPQHYVRSLRVAVAYPHMTSKNISDMTGMYTKRDVGHDPYYTPTQIGTVTGGNGSMEMAIVCILNTALYSVVLHINGISTQVKEKHLLHGPHA